MPQARCAKRDKVEPQLLPADTVFDLLRDCGFRAVLWPEFSADPPWRTGGPAGMLRIIGARFTNFTQISPGALDEYVFDLHDIARGPVGQIGNA